MNWLKVRTHFAALMIARDLTQDQIAQVGGLTGQNAISRLLANSRRGPSVETFLRALDGLGLTPAQFFTDLDRQGGGHEATANSDRRAEFDFAHLKAIIEDNFTEVRRRLDQLGPGHAPDMVALSSTPPPATIRRRRRARRPQEVA